MPASRCRASVGRGNTSGHGRYWIWRATSKPTSCAGRSTAAGAGRFAALRGGAGQAASRMHIRASITALRYANKTGSRLFVPRSTAAFGAGPLYGRTQARPVDRQGVLRYRFAYAASAGGVRRRSASEIRNDRKPLRKDRIRGLVQRRQVAHPHPPAAPFGPLPAKRVCSLPRIHAGRRPRLFGQNRPAQR